MQIRAHKINFSEYHRDLWQKMPSWRINRPREKFKTMEQWLVFQSCLHFLLKRNGSCRIPATWRELSRWNLAFLPRNSQFYFFIHFLYWAPLSTDHRLPTQPSELQASSKPSPSGALNRCFQTEVTSWLEKSPKGLWWGLYSSPSSYSNSI